jgi:hypothetical protein
MWGFGTYAKPSFLVYPPFQKPFMHKREKKKLHLLWY